MSENRPQIVALGASTPIGQTIWASAAAARAGICGFSEHPFMIDTAGEPIRVARVPWLDVNIEGVERFCALLYPALEEALIAVQPRIQQGDTRLGLALALPGPRPGRPAALGESLLEAIAQRYPGVFMRAEVLESGHAAGHLCLQAAMKALAHHDLEGCLVAGVDSYLAPETLEWIESCDQLHGAGLLNNAWGFIPGEAAAAIAVLNDGFARRINADALGEILGVGVARETKLIKTDLVCIGEGLTHAFKTALQGLAPPEQIHNVFCDLNGETYRADEYAFAALRTGQCFRAASDFVAPADCWGDIGAAGTALHTALAVISHRKHYGKGPLSLVSASSEAGDRGAAVIRAFENES